MSRDTIATALIDPFRREVRPYIYSGDWTEIGTAINAALFDAARFNGAGDAVMVDDEGLFRDEQAFFTIDGYPHPLAGYGLVLGVDSDGESIAPSLSVAEIKQAVHWLDAIRDPDTGRTKLVIRAVDPTP